MVIMFLSGKLGVSENDDTKQDYSIKKSEHMRHEMLFIERILGLRLSTLLYDFSVWKKQAVYLSFCTSNSQCAMAL